MSLYRSHPDHHRNDKPSYLPQILSENSNCRGDSNSGRLQASDRQCKIYEHTCWMTVAGHDPIAYLTKYPDRNRLLHIKEFHKGFTPTTTLMERGPNAPVPTELGRGAIDYRKILSAASKGQIRALFVEQEPPFAEMPALDAIKVDYDYLKSLHA